MFLGKPLFDPPKSIKKLDVGIKPGYGVDVVVVRFVRLPDKMATVGRAIRRKENNKIQALNRKGDWIDVDLFGIATEEFNLEVDE